MQKRTIKSLIALFGLGILLSHSASASMLGFGKKQTREERIASQLANAPVDEAVSLANEEHVNDGNNSKCLTFGKSGANIATFAGMAKNGCFPDGTQFSAISKIRQDFCIANCTDGTKSADKCDASDPQKLKDLCDRYCRNVNLGSPRAQDLLSTCFATWGLTKPMSFEEAAAYQGTAKSGAAAQKTEAKQSAGEISGYKSTVNKAITSLKAYFDAREKFEAEREKVVEATDKLMDALADVQSEKAELIAAKISTETLNKAEQDAMKAGAAMNLGKPILTTEQVEEVGILPATSDELGVFKAKFTGALRAAIASIVKLAKEAQSEVGADKFAKVVKQASKGHKMREMARRARDGSKSMKKSREADEAVDAMPDSMKARMKGRNPMHSRR